MTLDQSDALACWRHAATDFDLMDVCDALKAIAEERRGRHAWDLMERAAVPDAVTAFRIANDPTLANLDDDERKAWMWVAAKAGDVEGVRQLVVILQTEAIMNAGEPHEQRRLMALSEMWHAAAIEATGAPLQPAENLDLAEEVLSTDGGADEEVEAVGRIVIPYVGDASAREGVDLTRRYSAVLGKRLRCVGSLPEPGVIETAVLARWPWAKEAARALESHFAVLRAADTDEVRLPPILLVGPPGCGKTSIAQFVCDLVGLPTTLIPCGGVADGGGLAAVTRGWSTARPSALAAAILQSQSANPALILDEVDKSSQIGAQNGSVQATLLQMVGAASYMDACLMAPIDIRSISFVATANELQPLYVALRERFEIVPVGVPRDEDIPVLLRNVRADFSKRSSIPERALPMLEERDIELLLKWFSKNRSARAFAMMYERLLRAIIAEQEQKPALATLH